MSMIKNETGAGNKPALMLVKDFHPSEYAFSVHVPYSHFFNPNPGDPFKDTRLSVLQAGNTARQIGMNNIEAVLRRARIDDYHIDCDAQGIRTYVHSDAEARILTIGLNPNFSYEYELDTYPKSRHRAMKRQARKLNELFDKTPLRKRFHIHAHKECLLVHATNGYGLLDFFAASRGLVPASAF